MPLAISQVPMLLITDSLAKHIIMKAAQFVWPFLLLFVAILTLMDFSKLKKTISLIVLSLVIVFACSKDEVYLADYTSLQIEEMIFDTSKMEYSFTYSNSPVYDTLQFALNINLQLTEKEQISSTNIPFINQALAYSKTVKEYIIKDRVSEIKIFTETNFDSTHLAETEVSDYFRAVIRDEKMDVNAFITTKDAFYNLNDVTNGISKFQILALQAHPTFDEKQLFRVEIHFESGRKLEKQSNLIEFK